MANNFKLKTFSGSATAADTAMTIYTCPAATQTTIIGLTVTNITGSQVTISVTLENNDGDNVYLVKDIPIPAGSAFIPVGGEQKVVLEADDVIKVTSDTDNSVDSTLSILEIS